MSQDLMIRPNCFRTLILKYIYPIMYTWHHDFGSYFADLAILRNVRLLIFIGVDRSIDQICYSLLTTFLCAFKLWYKYLQIYSFSECHKHADASWSTICANVHKYIEISCFLISGNGPNTLSGLSLNVNKARIGHFFESCFI